MYIGITAGLVYLRNSKTIDVELIPPQVTGYAEKFSSAEDDLLKEVYEYTYTHHSQPHMLSGHLQGQFLTLMSLVIQPYRILEIGTFTGYSTLCLAKGLTAEGQIHTIELRETDAAYALKQFTKSVYKHQIHLHVGNAKDIIPSLHEEWDLVFIDADKTGYIEYYEMAMRRLKKGGIILADNVLFHGEVLNDPPQGKNAKAIAAFNHHVATDERVDQVLLTIRDGILMIRKK